MNRFHMESSVSPLDESHYTNQRAAIRAMEEKRIKEKFARDQQRQKSMKTRPGKGSLRRG